MRAILTGILASLALLSGLGGYAQSKKADRPHIVFILADDLGWKDVGYHGSEIKTPHIDRLAYNGVRLEQHYVQPVCSPTRAALLTGRYPIRTGLQTGVVRPWADYGLPLDERTLPQELEAAGYSTAITGKWHLGAHAQEYLPQARGFDLQYGHYLGAIDYFTHSRMGGLDWHRDQKALREAGYTTQLIAKEAVGIIDKHPTSQPLFLYVPFNAPHTPLQAPQEYLDRYAHIQNPKRRKFAAMVTCMDDAIGAITAALEKRGMTGDTLLIFSSDNGGPTRNGADNGDLRGAKGSLYEGGTRVPAFAVWPGKLKPGRIVEHPVHACDWYPTLTRLAGIKRQPAKPLDGYDIWPLLSRGKASKRREILLNVEANRGAVRMGDWKLVVRGGLTEKDARPNHTVELFNLAEDPNERNNLAAANPDQVRRLHQRLLAFAKEAEPAKGIGGGRVPKDFKTPTVWGEFE